MFYKVVKRRADDDSLVSCVAGGVLSVTYVPGERASSPYGPLLVFDDLEAARDFRNLALHAFSRHENEAYEAWECEIGKRRDIMVDVLRNVGGSDCASDVEAFWRGNILAALRLAPIVTIATDWVKLTRKVDE